MTDAWDAASARLVEQTSGQAVATTNTGVAWGIGAPDADRLARHRALDLIARAVAAVDVPVTADVGSGFANSPDGVAETIRCVLAVGAVGATIEDVSYSAPTPLRPTCPCS